MKLKILTALIFFTGSALAQGGAVKDMQGPSSYSLNSILTDLKGEPLATGTSLNVQGSPFYVTEWVESDLILQGGKRYERIMVRVNLETDRIHYLLKQGKSESVAGPGVVTTVRFIDPTTNVTTSFQCGFPVIDKNDLMTYYQVLAEGKITLLKQMKRILIEEKPFNSASVNRRYDTAKGYYAFVNNGMTKVKRSKSELVELMADQEEKVKNFISENKLVLKEDIDLAKLIAYYNSLQ